MYKFLTFLESLRNDENDDTITAISEGVSIIFGITEAEYQGYHGTKTVFGDFEYEETGKGVDQLGPGFYFTNNSAEASGYAGSDEGANVRPAMININKPIILDANENTKQTPLTRAKILKIIKSTPNMQEILGDMYDIKHYGLNYAINITADNIEGSDLWYQLKLLMNDLFKWNLESFAPVIKKVTGYDGIIKTVTPESTHYVAWSPSQIKSLYAGR